MGTRTLDHRHASGGSYQKYGGWPLQLLINKSATYPCGTWVQTTDINPGFGTDNGFETRRTFCTFETLDGDYVVGGNLFRHVVNWPVYGIANYAIPRSTYHARPDFASEAIYWLARMRPGQPAFNLPAILGELPDLPSLFTHLPETIRSWGAATFGKRRPTGEYVRPWHAAMRAGRRAAAEAGNAHVAFNFGVKPTVMDVMEVLGCLKALLAAIRLLADLANGKAIKRSLRLDPQRTQIEDGITTTESEICFPVRHNRVRVYHEKSWVSSRWEAILPFVHAIDSQEELVERAIRLVSGLTLSGLAEAWWELLPWSWLVDWIARVQELLGFYLTNPLLLKPVSLCWMRTSVVDVYWVNVETPSWATCSGQSFHQEVTKERIPCLAEAFEPHRFSALPGFSPRQWSILAGLAAQRWK